MLYWYRFNGVMHIYCYKRDPLLRPFHSTFDEIISVYRSDETREQQSCEPGNTSTNTHRHTQKEAPRQILPSISFSPLYPYPFSRKGHHPQGPGAAPSGSNAFREQIVLISLRIGVPASATPFIKRNDTHFASSQSLFPARLADKTPSSALLFLCSQLCYTNPTGVQQCKVVITTLERFARAKYKFRGEIL